jgi:hypothetical protein
VVSMLLSRLVAVRSCHSGTAFVSSLGLRPSQEAGIIGFLRLCDLCVVIESEFHDLLYIVHWQRI